MLPDGRLVYLGRKDDQVKIRGGKVSGSEAEAHLLSHPEIKNAAVIPLEQRSGKRFWSLISFRIKRRRPP